MAWCRLYRPLYRDHAWKGVGCGYVSSAERGSHRAVHDLWLLSHPVPGYTSLAISLGIVNDGANFVHFRERSPGCLICVP